MAFRFRRTLKLAPGVRLNLGKTGASIRLGVRGAGVTVGRRGTTASAGLPGTGLHVSEKLGKRTHTDSKIGVGSGHGQARLGFWSWAGIIALAFLLFALIF